MGHILVYYVRTDMYSLSDIFVDSHDITVELNKLSQLLRIV
ncbi:hypothetical protein DSUL_90096 [Desulfovibrionales bacterium]